MGTVWGRDALYLQGVVAEPEPGLLAIRVAASPRYSAPLTEKSTSLISFTIHFHGVASWEQTSLDDYDGPLSVSSSFFILTTSPRREGRPTPEPKAHDYVLFTYGDVFRVRAAGHEFANEGFKKRPCSTRS